MLFNEPGILFFTLIKKTVNCIFEKIFFLLVRVGMTQLSTVKNWILHVNLFIIITYLFSVYCYCSSVVFMLHLCVRKICSTLVLLDINANLLKVHSVLYNPSFTASKIAYLTFIFIPLFSLLLSLIMKPARLYASWRRKNACQCVCTEV